MSRDVIGVLVLLIASTGVACRGGDAPSGRGPGPSASPGAGPAAAAPDTQVLFAPAIAEVVAVETSRDGVRTGVIVALHEEDLGRCGATKTRSMLFTLPAWQRGLEVDVSTLRTSDPSKGYAENAASAKTWFQKLDPALGDEGGSDSRRDPFIRWRPKGTIELLHASPTSAAEQVRVNLVNHGAHVIRDLAVRVCVPPDELE